MPRKRRKQSKGSSWLRRLNPDKPEPKPLARAPAAMDGQVGTEIGIMIEFELSAVELDYDENPSPPNLLWFPEPKALGWFVNAKMPKASAATANDLADFGFDTISAADSFKAFMGRGPTWKAYSYGFPYRSTRDWYSVGPIKKLVYWSDKNRKTGEYAHEFGAGVRLYVYGSPRPKGPSFWLVKGGSLRLTKWGIEG